MYVCALAVERRGRQSPTRSSRCRRRRRPARSRRIVYTQNTAKTRHNNIYIYNRILYSVRRTMKYTNRVILYWGCFCSACLPRWIYVYFFVWTNCLQSLYTREIAPEKRCKKKNGKRCACILYITVYIIRRSPCKFVQCTYLRVK
jgi:hypothetical protein